MQTSVAVSVIQRAPVGDGLLAVTVAWPPEFASAHTAHGQFVPVAMSDTPEAPEAYFVLANAPGAAHAELLVRPRGAIAEALGSQETVLLGGPRGPGFGPIPRELPLVVVVTGSALAAVRSLLLERSTPDSNRKDPAAKTTLFFGTSNANDLPWADLFAELSTRGVAIVLAASNDASAGPSAAYPIVPGFVQGAVLQHFASDPPPPMTTVITIGQRELVDDMRVLCTQFSLAAPRMNF